jgi:hypothetical protein
MDRPKRVEKELDPAVAEDIETILTGMERTARYISPLDVQQILDVIPRTKARRRGVYEYVRVDLSANTSTYSEEPSPKAPEIGYLHAYHGHDHVRVFLHHPTSKFVKATVIQDRLLLWNERFFLFARP